MQNKSYKKILICPSSRINFEDSTNNGLLFRNLLKNWPKDKVGQIYNNGDNGDKGFFNHYYKLSSADRRFGKLFSRMHKSEFHIHSVQKVSDKKINKLHQIFNVFKKLLLDSGFYELFFRPKLSVGLKNFLDYFEPDLILLQGYSLTNIEIPLLIKYYTKAKLVFFTTDDWPKYLYFQQGFSFLRLFSFLPRLQLKYKLREMIREVDIPIAFGELMRQEYSERYSKSFHSIIHSDDYSRFENTPPFRLLQNNILSIVTIGTFNRYRWPLLSDFELSCEVLKNEGISAKVTVVSDQIEPEGVKLINLMNNINLVSDPGSDKIISYLKGADILLLIEGFDENYAEAIKYSISTKAHLYMFSGRPILIYSHKKAGIVNYASKFGWAKVINERNVNVIADCLKKIYLDHNLQDSLIKNAYKVAFENHSNSKNEEKLYEILHS